ncbi:arginine--tRNA ligase [Candidiatus Paracoxiella cheracis]|uniref:arginine--tRNA ligase n=1 Tax=Candidiatus Paracoxiella cheracis TaxID=3405120 RepID=UPI003BF53B71
MKNHIESLLKEAVDKLKADGTLNADLKTPIQVTPARDPKHGDFATNLALMLAKPAGVNPRLLAEKIIARLPESEFVTDVEIADPGFINFFIAEQSLKQIVPNILEAGNDFGQSDLGKNKRVHIEFVSANPTGPLHVGHGRGAAYGACVSNLLAAVGYDVHREYYVNDAGRQMRILALSVWVRYLQAQGEAVKLPPNAYQGQYIIDIAKELIERHADRFRHSQQSIDDLMPKDINPETDKETYVDAFVDVAKKLLGEENFETVFHAALDNILDDIKEDLEEFGITYNDWFPESNLVKKGLIQAGIQLLAEHGYVYEKEGAQWFRASELGDEKDRVLIRKNGHPTYFASDVAYHFYKFQQGYDHVIDVFGADHHGYIARVRTFLKALGEDPEKLRVLLVQFAILYRGKQKVQMSTRSGEFVTLRELRREVGNDAARFFYVMRKPEQHLDFDLELAKSKSSENPVYYIQYAHARICSVWRQLAASNHQWDKAQGLSNLTLLSNNYEKDLLTSLGRYPDIIKKAATQYEPHLLAHYLQELANYFHTYYNAEKFLVEEDKLRNARLCLIAATKQIIVNGLTLLGVSAPEEM